MVIKPLTDHRILQERWCSERRWRGRVAREVCEFVSQLAAWDWFATLTFARALTAEVGVREASAFFTLLGFAAVEPVGWFAAAEVGRLGRRVHCHCLVTGVSSLQPAIWQQLACNEFGRTTLEFFDPKRAAARYTTKLIAGKLSAFDLGGTLNGADLSRFEEPLNIKVGRQVIVPSDNMAHAKF